MDSVADMMRKIGLVNADSSKYLTLETFGFKLNVDGVSLRKKQIWTLEQEQGDATIYLKSHLGTYLSSDRKGNVTCDSNEKDDEKKFTIESQADGKWALKNFYNEYLGGITDELRCVSRPSKSEYWFVHLAMHPQVNLLHVKRKRYAHLTQNGELRVSETIPWGADALITLSFIQEKGKYALVTSSNKYLSRDGSLLDVPTDDSLFTIEFHDNQVAFRDSQGKYLTAVGQGNMQSKLSKVGQDEVFKFEDSPPQCSLIGHNDRKVSIKQGVDVTANQRGEIEDTEIFQLEFDNKSRKVAFHTNTDKYWVVDGGVTATGSDASKSMFDLEWHGSKIVLKSPSGKYITATSNGKLHEGAAEPNDASYFTIELLNRPLLVLRQENGFVGTTASGKIECGRANYTVFKTKGENGTYKMQAPTGKFWVTNSDVTISATADEASADSYTLELQPHSQLCIKAPNGNYVQAGQNGIFTAKGPSVDKSTLWEY